MNALGIIETHGLTAAVEAADVAVKSANVELIGYELTKGSGMVSVKITGDVGAVNAAMHAAKGAVPQVTRVIANVTIPRPSKGVESMVFSKDTVGYRDETVDEPKVEQAVAEPVEVTEAVEEAPAEAPASEPLTPPLPDLPEDEPAQPAEVAEAAEETEAAAPAESHEPPAKPEPKNPNRPPAPMKKPGARKPTPRKKR